MTKPALIGFCGYPQAGKSTAALILHLRYGVELVDDSWPLRDFAIRHLGAAIEDVTTQAGKNRLATVCGKTMMWRRHLGLIGDGLEATYGDSFLTERAVVRCTDPNRVYAFSSVRKTQGVYLKGQGALIVELKRKGCVPSAPFDEYERSCVDFTIHNDFGPEALVADLIARFDLRLRVVDDAPSPVVLAEIARGAGMAAVAAA